MEMPDWLAEALKQGKSVHCHVKEDLYEEWKEDDIGGFNVSHDCPYKSANYTFCWRYAEPYTPPACTLKPFQHVLGRNTDDEYWRMDFFDEFDPDSEYPYICFLNKYSSCIPYDGNEKYKGTSDNFVND